MHPIGDLGSARKSIHADIAETNIARQALDRGGALVDDAYQVRLEITTEIDSHGNKKPPRYKILEVVRFVAANPPMKQTSLFQGG